MTPLEFSLELGALRQELADLRARGSVESWSEQAIGILTHELENLGAASSLESIRELGHWQMRIIQEREKTDNSGEGGGLRIGEFRCALLRSSPFYGNKIIFRLRGCDCRSTIGEKSQPAAPFHR
jgi:hypothetical protein